MKEKRDNIPAASRRKKSSMIAEAVRKLAAYRKAKTVMFYMNINSEVMTSEMVKNAVKDGKNIVLPYLGKEKSCIRTALIRSLEQDLVKGAYGIMEPDPGLCKTVPASKIDMAVIPAVAYDISCRRIGYGGGYYDRWLKKIPRSARVGVAFDSQVISAIPQCKNDIKVNLVVTEKRLIRQQRKKVFKSRKEQ